MQSTLEGDAAKPGSSNDPISAEDEELWYEAVSDLAEQNAQLRASLQEKDVEIFNTRIHAETFASDALRDSRHKAEQALAYQKGTFEVAHEEYATTLKDMAEAHVATSTANLEAQANSIIGQQQNALINQSMLVANLEQHLGNAQHHIELETSMETLVEARAKTEVEAQKKSSERNFLF